MAKSDDGLFDKLSGKIGDVVFASWRGIPYIRSKPSGNPSNTKAQQEQRSKFGVVVKFVGRILPVINAGFKWRLDEMPERNAAISYLMKNGIRGKKPEIYIDYPRVKVARGGLPAPKEASAHRVEERLVSVKWKYNQQVTSARKDDSVIALAYAPKLQKGVWKIGGDVARSDEAVALKLPEAMAKQELHIYLAFANTTGTDASDSVYLGSL